MKVLVYHPDKYDIYRELLRKDLPEVDLLLCHNRDEVEKHAGEAEIAFVNHTIPQDLFQKMPKLKWVQVMAAGAESFFQNGEQFKNIPVCRVIGVHGKYIVEYVMAYILFLCQNINRVLRAQREKTWDPFVMEYIHKKIIGIMGLGIIGSVVANQAKAMGMQVISWDLERKEASFVDKQYITDQMEDFLKEADFVVLTLPVTPATVNLVNREFFGFMKESSYLINVCRGEVVDEESLIEALKGGKIAGAVIDVFKKEPLPPESELWKCPNLIISPHLAGWSLPEDMVKFFKSNFQRYLKKEPLIGTIDFHRGF